MWTSRKQTSQVSVGSSVAHRSESCLSLPPGSEHRKFITKPIDAESKIVPSSYSSFPYLVSINAVLPAILAGNAVLLKPSPQTPLTAERFALALTRAGVPADIIQVLHLSPELVVRAVQHPLVDFVSFTGSVVGGQAVEKAAVDAEGFKGIGLEVSVPELVVGMT